MPDIALDGVDLEFRVSIDPHDSFRAALGRRLRGQGQPVRVIPALRGLSFSIKAGERVGLIGHNGAGKTTLLKLLSGIYPPQRGTVRVSGHVCPLFEFATGFEMEANGWDNIRTRALLLGMSGREIEEKLHSIAAFAGLGDFLDVPVRCYSSGMLLRLAFATSTAVDPEILLLDEVMAAGDADFIESARGRMNALMERASIVVFATHSLGVLPSFCERTLLLNRGQIVADGPTAEVVEQYIEGVANAQAARLG